MHKTLKISRQFSKIHEFSSKNFNKIKYIVYIDDILVFGKNQKENYIILMLLKDRLEKLDEKNEEKSLIRSKEVEFLGFKKSLNTIKFLGNLSKRIIENAKFDSKMKLFWFLKMKNFYRNPLTI